MKLKLYRTTTTKIIRIFVQDSSKTDGSGLTGLTSSSSGLVCYYIREGDSSPQQVLLQAGTVGTYSSNGQTTGSTYGFVEVSSSNMPGVYELNLPNAALASGNSCLVMLKGATNMAPVLAEIELDATDYQSANDFITGINGLAPPTNWNILSIDGSGRTNLGQWLGHAVTVDANNVPNVAVLDWAGEAVPTPNVTGVPKVDMTDINGTTVSTTGTVQIDMTQTIPTSNTGQTVGDALNAARAQGFGKWVLSGTTLTLYAADGTTTVRTPNRTTRRR